MTGPWANRKRPRLGPNGTSLSQCAARKGLGAIVVACSLVGVALLSAALFLGSKEVGQLVQRAPISPAARPAVPPAAAPVEPVEVAMPAQVPASPAMAAPLPAAPAAERPAIAGVAARAEVPPVPAQPQSAPAPPLPAPAAPSVLAASLEPPIVAAMAASAPPSPQPPRPVAGLTLAEAQPLLVSVLQQVQSGSGERLLTLLDQDARAVPAALALSRQLDALADGGRPVKLTHVEFRAEPGEGRLYVTGHMQLHFDGGAPAPAKRLSLRAEFVSRNGTVVLTALSGMGGN